MGILCWLLVFLPSFLLNVEALNNGVARTPPMGWLSWEYYAANTDCTQHPDTCVSSKLYERVADALVADGYRDVGYTTVNVDDAWMDKSRDPITNALRADQSRFPGGIAALCRYLHKRGLQCGLYEDIGTRTCAGYPGLNVTASAATDAGVGATFGTNDEPQYVRDARMMASWKIDSLKVDGCNAVPSDYHVTYPAFGRALNATGRSIVYACSWPAYTQHTMTPAVYATLAASCNLWRNYNDIDDSFDSVKSIIGYWIANQPLMVKTAGPGAWNDPDMLLIGDTGLSHSEQQIQMAMWSIWAAPLLMSNDLSLVSERARAILQNREVIAVNQDVGGWQGRCVNCKLSPSSPTVPIVTHSERAAERYDDRRRRRPRLRRRRRAQLPQSTTATTMTSPGKHVTQPQQQVWVRQITGGWAVALLNLHVGVPSFPTAMTVTASDLGIATAFQRLQARDLFAHQDLGVFQNGAITVDVPTNGVVLLKVTMAP